MLLSELIRNKCLFLCNSFTEQYLATKARRITLSTLENLARKLTVSCLDGWPLTTSLTSSNLRCRHSLQGEHTAHEHIRCKVNTRHMNTFAARWTHDTHTWTHSLQGEHTSTWTHSLQGEHTAHEHIRCKVNTLHMNTFTARWTH